MMENRPTTYPNSCRMNKTSTTSTASNRSLSNMANTTTQKPCKKELMDTINQCSFAVNDATLFLDTHPYDTEALAYLQLHREHRVTAMKEYAKYYAPLTIDCAICDKTPWCWVNEPWPWEGVDC